MVDLGVRFDKNLTFMDHISVKISKAYSVLGIIKRNWQHQIVKFTADLMGTGNRSEEVMKWYCLFMIVYINDADLELSVTGVHNFLLMSWVVLCAIHTNTRPTELRVSLLTAATFARYLKACLFPCLNQCIWRLLIMWYIWMNEWSLIKNLQVKKGRRPLTLAVMQYNIYTDTYIACIIIAFWVTPVWKDAVFQSLLSTLNSCRSSYNVWLCLTDRQWCRRKRRRKTARQTRALWLITSPMTSRLPATALPRRQPTATAAARVRWPISCSICRRWYSRRCGNISSHGRSTHPSMLRSWTCQCVASSSKRWATVGHSIFAETKVSTSAWDRKFGGLRSD